MSEPSPPSRRSTKEIFFEALDKSTSEERAAFIDDACGQDLAQRAQVEAQTALSAVSPTASRRPARFESGRFIRAPRRWLAVAIKCLALAAAAAVLSPIQRFDGGHSNGLPRSNSRAGPWI